MSEDARKPEHLVSIQATPSVDVLDDAVSKKKTHAPSADIYMKSWKIVSICLLLSTLFQSIKPSDPYLPKFFIDGKGISKEDVRVSFQLPMDHSLMFLGLSAGQQPNLRMEDLRLPCFNLACVFPQ